MTRKLAAALFVLALASCFGRVSAWAAAPGDAHACCRGESPAPAEGPALAECCATSAAVQAPKTADNEISFIVVSAPEIKTILAVSDALLALGAPPGPQTLRSSVPARAPPLA